MYDRTKTEKKRKKSEVLVGTETWNKERIVDLLKSNDKAVERAILRIYNFQTDEEKYVGATKTVNGKGFNKMDVELLSSFAVQLRRGHNLSDKQMFIARIKIQKYAGQLLSYMKSKYEVNLET